MAKRMSIGMVVGTVQSEAV